MPKSSLSKNIYLNFCRYFFILFLSLLMVILTVMFLFFCWFLLWRVMSLSLSFQLSFNFLKVDIFLILSQFNPFSWGRLIEFKTVYVPLQSSRCAEFLGPTAAADDVATHVWESYSCNFSSSINFNAHQSSKKRNDNDDQDEGKKTQTLNMSQIRLKTKPNIQIEFGYLPSFPWN